MASKSKQKKWTAAQIKEHIRNIEKAIEKHKRENKEGKGPAPAKISG